ncbi:hypothetical protein [Actinoplanes friuliensis]|uniref:Uncharacterized protein n=1 Tax=Actinoplanes friuliensis DSM 7358 TaxID=1246995 RepID=U5W335_9ACTN|nr:hypothetical protein [Actinoplanes friuliensis]AGZ42405.1 hypothetical protein AFR_20665 [Actinoplanes friuliensis DSM 7358]
MKRTLARAGDDPKKPPEGTIGWGQLTFDRPAGPAYHHPARHLFLGRW